MKSNLKVKATIAAIGSLLISAHSAHAALPKDVTLVPFYDINDTALSFKQAEQSVVGMYEVPGMPEHFLVLGYFGYVWSLYPDISKTYAPGAIKDYKKKQVANFNNMVCKGWEQGALGGGFDPNFATNHYFYIIYNKYAEVGKYHGGTQPNGNDGPGVSALVSVERWKLSNDLATLTRDTTIFLANHSFGFGSSNMTFGKDGLLYISTDAYSQNSWDSTIFMRKILRIDVSKQDAGKMYSIPPSNPFYNATNPLVKKEIFAFGFRNTYAIVNDMITGSILGAEVGQETWEEVNIIKPGKNYGWANGGDGEGGGVGIEGPCSENTVKGGAYRYDAGQNGVSRQDPYSFKGDQSQQRTFTCADFTNGTWNFSHSGQALSGTATSLPGTGISCIILSQAYRGDPSSDFYGYHFVTDVNRKYFLAIKEGVSEVVNVGGVPSSYQFAQNDVNHDGITSFSEDSYGNMYVTMLSSSGSGAFDWHDIYKLKSTGMKARTTVNVSPVQKNAIGLHDNMRTMVLTSLGAASFLKLPSGMKHAEIYSLEGKMLWSNTNTAAASVDGFVRLPALVQTGAVGVRYMP